jgi:hypothetical protein
MKRLLATSLLGIFAVSMPAWADFTTETFTTATNSLGDSGQASVTLSNGVLTIDLWNFSNLALHNTAQVLHEIDFSLSSTGAYTFGDTNGTALTPTQGDPGYNCVSGACTAYASLGTAGYENNNWQFSTSVNSSGLPGATTINGGSDHSDGIVNSTILNANEQPFQGGNTNPYLSSGTTAQGPAIVFTIPVTNSANVTGVASLNFLFGTVPNTVAGVLTPEPSLVAALSFGMIGLFFFARSRRQKDDVGGQA